MMMKVLFSALLMTLFFTLSCGGEKFALPEAPEENDGTIAVSDTTYIQLTPVWEPATGYDLNQPKDILIGREPLIYVADTGNNRILMLDLAGNILGESQQVENPVGLTQDSKLNLLIVTDTNKIYRINLVAIQHDIAVAPVELMYEEVDNPDRRYTGILPFLKSFQGETVIEYFVSATGNDTKDNQILKFPEDFFVEIIPGEGATLTANGFGMLSASSPSGLTAIGNFSEDFIFCMVGQNNFKVQWLTPSEFGYVALLNPANGNFDLFEPGKFSAPEDVTLDEQGNIYIVDADLDRMFKFSASGDELQSFGVSGDGERQFNGPHGVAFFDRTLYVADTGNNRILRFRLSTDIGQ